MNKKALGILLPNEWNVARLAEVSDVRDGTHDSPKYQESGIPFITSKNLKSGKVDFTTCNFISEEDHKKFSERSKVENGDIIFGMIGTLGSPVIVNTNFEFSIKNVALVKFNNTKLFNQYMKYLLGSTLVQREFERISDGGVQKFISLSTIRSLQIPIPPLKEQQKIAEILSSVDTAIEKTEQVIAKTEEVKKGLMQQLLTKGIGHTEFKETEIGEIPVCWELTPMNKLGEFKNGLNKSKEDFGFGSYFVNISDIYINEIIEERLLGRLNATDKEREIYKLNKGDIVIVRSSVKPEGVGYPILYRDSKEDVLYCGFTIRYRYNQETLFDKYLLHVLRGARVRKDVLKYASISANTNINQESYGKIKIPIPPFEEQVKIAHMIDKVNEKITIEKTKLTRFKLIKQGLMQQLLTGQVRVKID